MDDGQGRYVMVVDDDDEIREALADVLTDEGYEVVGARDGLQALQYLRGGRRPQAILLDLWMPVMDGWQLRHELLSDSKLSDIPVIVLTAVRDQRAQGLMVADILTKPVQLERLLGALAATTRQS
jgi:CheY-like chemotaxis protein